MLGFLPERMGIIGEHPESGVRLDVQRPPRGGPPWRYEGEAVTPTGRHRVVVDVEPDGTVRVVADTPLPPFRGRGPETQTWEPVRTPEARSAEGADLTRPVRTSEARRSEGADLTRPVRTPEARSAEGADLTRPVRTPEARSAEGADLTRSVRLIMRAAWKHAHADGAPPPRRVVRWRPDR
jgi:hypothetical protein